MDGFSVKEAAASSQVTRDTVQSVKDAFSAALEKEVDAYLDQGLTSEEMSALFSATRNQLTAEQRKLAKARLMRRILPEENTQRVKRKKKPLASDATKEERDYQSNQPWEYTGFDPSNKYQVAQVLHRLASVNASNWDKAQEFWINAILSGPMTNSVNIIGNGSSIALEYTLHRPIESIVASMIGAKGATQGKEELVIIYKALLPSISKGWKDAVKTWAPETDFLQNDYLLEQLHFSEIEQYSERGAISGAKGRAVRIPGRLLRFMDTFFKSIVMNAEVGAQAYRIGKANKLENNELQTFIRGEVNTPGSASWNLAYKQAIALTFQDKLPKIVQNLADMRNIANTKTIGGKLAASISTLIFPFVRTPYNILAMGLRKSPLGIFNMALHGAEGGVAVMRGNSFESGYSRAKIASDLAEQLVAWSMAGILYAMVGEGDDDDDDKMLLITGGRPWGLNSKGERDFQNRTYGGNYQIRVGGKGGLVIPYGRIEPLATILGTTVDAIRLAKGTNDSTVPFKVAGIIASQLKEKTFLSGVSGLLDALDGANDPDKSARSTLRQVAGIIPNILKQPFRNWDEYIRDSRFAPAAYTFLPASFNAEKEINLYGNEVEKSSIAPLRLVLPFTTKTTDEKGDQFLKSWNANNKSEAFFPAKPNRSTYEGMTRIQANQFDRKAGEIFKRKLDVWLTPERIKNPTETDLERFKDNLVAARRQAKQVTKVALPEKFASKDIKTKKSVLPWE